MVVDKGTGEVSIRVVHTYQVSEDLTVITSPETVAQLMDLTVGITIFAEEVMYACYLNANNKVIGISRISHGTLATTLASPREVLLRALFINANSFIIVHNHPSLNVSPSSEDVAVTKKMGKAGEIMNIKLLDSIIVGDGYCSLKEKGLM